MRYVETGFLIQILLHKCKVEVICKLFTSFAKKLQEDLENTFSYLFHNHDVNEFRKYSSNHISKVYKVLSKKINMCEHATFFMKFL